MAKANLGRSARAHQNTLLAHRQRLAEHITLQIDLMDAIDRLLGCDGEYEADYSDYEADGTDEDWQQPALRGGAL